MSNLDLPMTEDGSGYTKEAVEEFAQQADYRARHLIQQAETLLNDALEKKERIIEEGENESKRLIDEAKVYHEESIVESNKLLDDAHEKSNNIEAELDNMKAQKLEEIKDDLDKERAKAEGIIKKAEQQSDKMLAEAKIRANSYIEENRSRVHGIVKNAENKRQEAEKKAKELILKSTRAYSDSIAGAGKLTKEAEEVLFNAKIESDTVLTYATEEAKNLKADSESTAQALLTHAEKKAQWITAESEAEASRIIEGAQKYSNEVAVWAAEEIEKSVSIINSYKAFYDDNISRMLALFNTNIEMVSALGHVQFPDGSQNFQTIDVVEVENKDTNNEAPIPAEAPYESSVGALVEAEIQPTAVEEEIPDELLSDFDSLMDDFDGNTLTALDNDEDESDDSPVRPPKDDIIEEVIEVESSEKGAK